ncbi:MAG: 50S ribosomal protein L15 [Candidatus Magasanikbacteria bacterium]|nr:50S ribosomal protein L15 [Candidatus Magasanikbacteria bacterium]
MKLAVHTIKPAKGSKHTSKRIGRGNASGHGTYSTRGGKGQTARAGGSHRLRLKAFKRMMQSTPKLRGFKSHFNRPAEVYLSDLEKYFDNGAVVNLAALKEKKIINARDLTAKILLKGVLEKKLVIEGVSCTKAAKAAIEKAGGEVK